MNEENTVPAENETVAEDSNLDTSPVDETTTSEEPATEAETSSAEESSEETEVSSERKPTRAERRIRDLTTRLKQYQEQEASQPAPQYQQPPQPLFEPGREYTAEELEQRLVQAANSIASVQTKAQLASFEAKANLDRDVEVLAKEYPELDETSDQFIPELVETIEEEFKARAIKNGALDPSVRLSEIAARHLKAARAVAKKQTAEVNKSIAESADTQALRPSAETRVEKTPADMTERELEEHLRKQGRFIKA